MTLRAHASANTRFAFGGTAGRKLRYEDDWGEMAVSIAALKIAGSSRLSPQRCRERIRQSPRRQAPPEVEAEYRNSRASRGPLRTPRRAATRSHTRQKSFQN